MSVNFTMDETTIDENDLSGSVSTSLMLSGLGNDGLGSPLSVTITITATKGGTKYPRVAYLGNFTKFCP